MAWHLQKAITDLALCLQPLPNMLSFDVPLKLIWKETKNKEGGQNPWLGVSSLTCEENFVQCFNLNSFKQQIKKNKKTLVLQRLMKQVTFYLHHKVEIKYESEPCFGDCD